MKTLTAADELVYHSLRTLKLTGRERLQPWLDRLQNWDSDEALRASAEPLPDMPGGFTLRAGPQDRVFFRVNGDTVTVLGFSTKQALHAMFPDAEIA